jgi:hypothetical protein
MGFAGLSAVACTHQGAAPVAAPRTFERMIQLNGAPLTLHLSAGTPARRRELLVYATGDGGWRGKDRDVFNQLESWGYATAAFSAPEYLKHLPGDDGTTTPARLALDFAHIVDVARAALQMPDSLPVVLVGVSRGAGLVVVAAGQPGLQPELGGVVAMALTREEEYVHRRLVPDVALELYTYLPRLGDVPLSVIQSTRDNYLPADDARELFGHDTPVRRFHAIDARNHSFGGARPELYATLRSSLDWVDRLGRRPAD